MMMMMMMMVLMILMMPFPLLLLMIVAISVTVFFKLPSRQLGSQRGPFSVRLFPGLLGLLTFDGDGYDYDDFDDDGCDN